MNAVVRSLLDGATDDDDVVRASICKALGDVASLHRAFVAKQLADRVESARRPMLGMTNGMRKRVLLLKVVAEVARRSGADAPSAKRIASVMVVDLTHPLAAITGEAAGTNSWKEAASEVLVALFDSCPIAVVDALLERFRGGSGAASSQPWIVSTIGALAASNPACFAPCILDVLALVVPTLGSVRSPAARAALASCFVRVLDAAAAAASAAADQRGVVATKSHVSISAMEPYVLTIVETLSSTWAVSFLFIFTSRMTEFFTIIMI